MLKIIYDAIGTLTQPLTESSKIAVVDSTLHGILAGAISAGDWAYLAIDDGNNIEIVKVYRVNSLGLRIVRGQDNTLPTRFIAGTAVSYKLTAIEVQERIVPPTVAITPLNAMGYADGEVSYQMPAIEDLGGMQSIVSGNEVILGRNEQAYGCCTLATPGAPPVPPP